MGKSRRSPKRAPATRAAGPRGQVQIPVWPTNANNVATDQSSRAVVSSQAVARSQDGAPAKIPVRKTGRRGGR